MSWDIHGSPLRPGYCEVHPSVHDWPCSFCQQEQAEAEAYRLAEADYREQERAHFEDQGDAMRIQTDGGA